MERTARLAPLTGAASVLLLLGSAIAVGYYEYLPAPGEIGRHLTDNSTAVTIGAYLGLLGAILFLWFAGSLRAALRAAERGDGRVSAIAFGGGVAAAALMAVTYSTVLAAAARAGSTGGIADLEAGTLYDFSSTLQGIGTAYAVAVLIGGYAVVAFRTAMTPRWVAWISAVLAVGSLTPLSYAFLGPDLVWAGAVSIALFAAGRRSEEAHPS